MNNKFNLILWGATGFTGQLVAEYLYKQYGSGGDLKWAMAARNEEKLKSVRQSLGDESIPILIADSHDLESLEQLTKRTSVICSTVGPYAQHGSLLVAACIKHRVDYCDLTGEVPWIRRMIDQNHEDAKARGVKIVHCCGFDSIPSDMGVYFLQNKAHEQFGNHCQQIKLRVKAAKGGLSGGTYASMKNVLQEAKQDPSILTLLANPYGLNPSDKQNGVDTKDSNEMAFDPDFNSWMAPFIMATINTRVVRRSQALAEFPYGLKFSYEEAMLTGRGMKGKLKAMIMTKVIQKMTAGGGGIFKKMADYFLPDPGEGPSKAQRNSGFFNIALLGQLANGQSILAKVTGDRDPGYGSTAKMLGESAVCLAKDRDLLPTTFGVITPSVAMGDLLLQRLQTNAGLEFKLVS